MSNVQKEFDVFDDQERQVVAYRLFEEGRDTSDIASFLRIRESEALRMISSQRSITLGLPSPYLSTPAVNLSARIRLVVPSRAG